MGVKRYTLSANEKRENPVFIGFCGKYGVLIFMPAAGLELYRRMPAIPVFIVFPEIPCDISCDMLQQINTAIVSRTAISRKQIVVEVVVCLGGKLPGLIGKRVSVDRFQGAVRRPAAALHDILIRHTDRV